MECKLGLQVPKSWDEFMSNNAKLKAGGVDPVIQTYGETWTSQLFVLGDFHNVAAAEPDFADRYTKNQAKYATSPAALKGFEHRAAACINRCVKRNSAGAPGKRQSGP